MTLKTLSSNCFTVVIVGAIAFLIHFLINRLIESAVTVYQLLYSYAINILLACGVIILLFVFKKKLQDQLGFLFMGASLLKFVFFFVLFYPEYNADGDLTRLEFLTFFIPYAICLITESVVLSKFLNSLDNSK
ncbi:DUF6168 family protein [Algibacter mikhailovii]|uniref:Uncharacterized protein n=1 Tax=Algibacter mikhailovii TaxID=425498 RepID=A0A918VD86_9FLAO|nr:DUF6168 family protein [Algibacter mikhailovii]GGZ89051.1 hypothetical protein GCM10007028_29060 [Algibacter mikhailovii]